MRLFQLNKLESLNEKMSAWLRSATVVNWKVTVLP